MGAASPAGRDTDNLVAGNALGRMFNEVRFRGFVITREDMDTGRRARSARQSRGRRHLERKQRRTSLRVPEIESRRLVRPAADISHGGESLGAIKGGDKAAAATMPPGRLAKGRTGSAGLRLWAGLERPSSGTGEIKLGAAGLDKGCLASDEQNKRGNVCGGDLGASTSIYRG